MKNLKPLDVFKTARLAMFVALLAFAAWQAVAAAHAPQGQAMPHSLAALVSAGVAVRLYLAKRSSINLALAELQRKTGK